MPHINLIYPFIEDSSDGLSFEEASDVITAAITHCKPFVVRFGADSFRCFRHNKNTCTLWLKPQQMMTSTSDASADQMTSLDDHSAMHSAVIEVQRHLQDIFDSASDPLENNDKCGFVPHLSLGQFRPREIESFVAKLRTSWKEITFEVSGIAIISRSGYHDPFIVRKMIKFGNIGKESKYNSSETVSTSCAADSKLTDSRTDLFVKVTEGSKPVSSGQNEVMWGGLAGLRFSL
jgi:hypothetical protein